MAADPPFIEVELAQDDTDGASELHRLIPTGVSTGAARHFEGGDYIPYLIMIARPMIQGFVLWFRAQKAKQKTVTVRYRGSIVTFSTPEDAAKFLSNIAPADSAGDPTIDANISSSQTPPSP